MQPRRPNRQRMPSSRCSEVMASLKELYARAEVLAKEAQATAEAEKERVKAEVADMLTQAKQALDDAGAALAKAPKGKGSKADIELIKNDLTAATARYDEAKMDFDAGKYIAARTKLEAVMQKAQSLTEEIANAAAKKAASSIVDWMLKRAPF